MEQGISVDFDQTGMDENNERVLIHLHLGSKKWVKFQKERVQEVYEDIRLLERTELDKDVHPKSRAINISGVRAKT